MASELSPLTLWHSEIVHTGADDFDIGDMCLFCIDADGPVGELEAANNVVPESTIQLTENQLNKIRQLLPDPVVDDAIYKIWQFTLSYMYAII